MMLEPLSKTLTSRGVMQTPLSCSQIIRLLMVSCRRCLTTQHRDTKKVAPLLASLKMDFLEAVRRNDAYRAQYLRQKLMEAGSERYFPGPCCRIICRAAMSFITLRQKHGLIIRWVATCRDLIWVHNAIINMHARRREPELAFAVAEEIRPRLDSFSYAGLLNACAKVRHRCMEHITSSSTFCSMHGEICSLSCHDSALMDHFLCFASHNEDLSRHSILLMTCQSSMLGAHNRYLRTWSQMGLCPPLCTTTP